MFAVGCVSWPPPAGPWVSVGRPGLMAWTKYSCATRSTRRFLFGVYEVPAAYIRQRIELRHPVDEPGDLYLYDNAVRVGRLKLVDARENARTFRPTKADTAIRFASKHAPRKGHRS